MTIELTLCGVAPCPQCGELVDKTREGLCVECCSENQASLDLHNAQFDRWEGMSDKERGDEIIERIK